jgi:hypothetical protein
MLLSEGKDGGRDRERDRWSDRRRESFFQGWDRVRVKNSYYSPFKSNNEKL